MHLHIGRLLLNIGDKASLFLSIVLFGFINIRYAFVCIVDVGDQSESNNDLFKFRVK